MRTSSKPSPAIPAGKQLYYHAWSANPEDVNSFWANKAEPHKGCSKEFWGRGMGWYFAALVDVLEVMPQSHPDYNELKTIVNTVAKGLARWQDRESGVRAAYGTNCCNTTTRS